MREARNRVPERAIERDLTGRRRKQICAADHFADARIRVVADDRELICPNAVGPPEHEITTRAFGIRPTQRVLEAG